MKKTPLVYGLFTIVLLTAVACGEKNTQGDQTAQAETNTSPGITPNLQQQAQAALAELNRATVVDGVAYESDSLATNSGGQVTSGTLASNANIGGTDYPAQTKLVFYSNGKVKQARLGGDTTVNGIVYQADTDVYFYESGSVESGVLAGYTKINKLTFQRDTRVFFHADGKFWKAILE
jgi:hypothetical protein